MRLERRFRILIAVVAFVGAAMALIADSPVTAEEGDDNHYWDATREIGGAVVSGAAVAWLVVWFEDRREDDRIEREDARDEERFKREQTREDEAAERALRRDVDIRLNTLIRTDLWNVRHEVVEDHAEDSQPQTTSALARSFRTSDHVPMRQICGEIESLLLFLRAADLLPHWNEWGRCYTATFEVPEPEDWQPPEAPTDKFGVLFRPAPPTRDPEQHEIAAAAEEKAWRSLIEAWDQHLAEYYPSLGDFAVVGD